MACSHGKTHAWRAQDQTMQSCSAACSGRLAAPEAFSRTPEEGGGGGGRGGGGRREGRRMIRVITSEVLVIGG